MRQFGNRISFLIITLVLVVSAPAYADDLTDAKRAYGAGEFSEAATLLRPLARAGNVDALFLLGRMYEQGDGVAKDLDEARNLFRQAAEKGHDDAAQRLALYENADSGDESVVIEWYLPAAQDGDIEAQYNLGYMYETGWGVRVDEKQAVKWYKEAADLQHDMAQLRLGMMYVVGQGVPQSQEKGVELLRMAAENGNRVAEVLIQELYDSGEAERLKADRIIAGLRRVVDEGEQDALRTLNASLDAARVRAQSSRKTEAANSRESTPARQAKTEDVPAHDEVKKPSVSSGSAKLNLGKLLNESASTPQGEKDSLKWYLASAREGNADAQYNLGILYMQGRGVSRDVQEALRWFRSAAGQGHESAKDYLQLWSNELDNATIGGTIGVTWLKEMARNWDAHSMYTLGFLFESGRGVNANPNEAKIWYRLASEAGHKDARKRLDLLVQGKTAAPVPGAKTQQEVTKPKAGKAVTMQIDWIWVTAAVIGVVAVVVFFMFRRGAFKVPPLNMPQVAKPSFEHATAGAAVAPDDMDFLKGLWDQPEKEQPPPTQPRKAADAPVQKAPERVVDVSKDKPIISEDDIPLPDLSAIFGERKREREKPVSKPQPRPPVVVEQPAQAKIEIAPEHISKDTLRPVEPPMQEAEPRPRYRRSIAAEDISRVGISRDELAAGRIDADNLFEEGLALDRAGKAVVKPKLDEAQPPIEKAPDETDSGFEFDTIDMSSLRRNKPAPQAEPHIPLKSEDKPVSRPVAAKKPKPKAQVADAFTDEEERSLAEVHFNIGVMFSTGEGVPRNDVMAAKWFLKAAEEGLPEAQFNIGEMYMTGTGIDKNPGQGMQWIQKAAANGYKPAIDALAKRSQG